MLIISNKMGFMNFRSYSKTEIPLGLFEQLHTILQRPAKFDWLGSKPDWVRFTVFW